MSILTSPSDNTGWGMLGNRLMRATGICGLGKFFSKRAPVRVSPYYRAQWGQLKGKIPLQTLRRRLRMYTSFHKKRVARMKRKRLTNRESKKQKTQRLAQMRLAISSLKRKNKRRTTPPAAPIIIVGARRSGRARRAPKRLIQN